LNVRGKKTRESEGHLTKRGPQEEKKEEVTRGARDKERRGIIGRGSAPTILPKLSVIPLKRKGEG